VECVYREEEDTSVGEICDGDVSICLLILSDEVSNSGKNLFASGPSWSGAGGFELYLWTERTLSIELELSAGKEGLVRGSGTSR